MSGLEGPVTYFACAERSSQAEVFEQAGSVRSVPYLVDLLNSVPVCAVVLNEHRQIVHANGNLLRLVGMDPEDGDAVLGMRPGEALHCRYADRHLGCGTSRFCRQCGAVKAILDCIQHSAGMEDCQIIREDGDELEAYDFRVTAYPLEVAGQSFIVFTLLDISHQKRRRVLERIFFHDILNTAGALRGFLELAMEGDGESGRSMLRMAHQLTGQLLNEIHAQKELAAAESNELKVDPSPFNSLEMLKRVAADFGRRMDGRGCEIRIDPDSADVTFITDPTLLGRVLINMVKNAVEASRRGDVVTLGCREENGFLRFRVHNPAVMPENVQHQVFKRSFSTKGNGRGLGTYSMKLLSHRYLKATVDFETSEQTGTEFSVTCPLKI